MVSEWEWERAFGTGGCGASFNPGGEYCTRPQLLLFLQGEILVADTSSCTTGALDHFAIPSDPNFPLNQAFEGPKDRQEAEVLRSYLSQVRQELAMRLHARLYEGGSAGPSKWWLSFGKRKFMGKSL